MAALLVRTVFAKGGFGRATIEAGSVSQAVMSELRVFPRDLLDEARRLGIHLPWLETAEPLLVS